jgi:Cu(I)/Ag(I) efflux system membrane fusion protein
MKRPLLLVTGLAIMALIVYFYFFKSAPKSDSEKDKPLQVSSDSDPFNVSYNQLLSAYYLMKDALVSGDTVSADAAAVTLANAADSVRLDELKGDSTGAIRDLARTFIMEINTAAKFYNAAPGLEERRRKFESITELVWNLTRSIRFSGATIYYHFCPMAFDNKGAYWLSSERLIRNPYFGDKMLTCGQVMDSLNFSDPQ